MAVRLGLDLWLEMVDEIGLEIGPFGKCPPSNACGPTLGRQGLIENTQGHGRAWLVGGDRASNHCI